MVSEAIQDKFTEKVCEVNALLEFNYPRYAILAAGMGIELLLPVLFEELNEHYKTNDVRSSYELKESLDKVRKEFKKNHLVEKDLTFQQWVYRYDKGGFVDRLSEAFGYEFEEFSISSIDYIRDMRNKCAHQGYYKDQVAIDHEIESNAEQIRDSFLRLLSETNRITQSRAIVLSNPLEQQREKSLLKREYDDVLRTNPDDIDVLFLRALILRGETSAQLDLNRILQLDPNHSEARKERIWNLNNSTLVNQSYKRSSSSVTQVNSASDTRNVSHQLNLVENKFSFLNVESQAARYLMIAILIVAASFGAVVLVMEGFDVLRLLIVEGFNFTNVSLSPHFPGILILVGSLAFVWIFRRTRKQSWLERFNGWCSNLIPWTKRRWWSKRRRQRKPWWKVW